MTLVIERIKPGDATGMAAVRELVAKAEHFDGFPAISDQAMLAAAQGTRAVLGASDESPLHAVGILGDGELDLLVRPDARGRGLGREMLRRMLDIAAQHPHDLRAWQHGENPAAAALLSAAGFAPARSLYRLALDPARLSESIVNARALPDGFALRAFDPSEQTQAEEWVRVNAVAFADHPEQGAITIRDFSALTAEPWFDPDDLVLAFDTTRPTAGGAPERLAGYTWIKTVRADESAGPETELYALGVDPAHAGRGLGAALLGETLRRMAEHAPSRITLYVDGDNTGARALYDRAGFVVDQRSTQWLRSAR